MICRPGSAAVSKAPATGRPGNLFRHEFLEIRRLAWVDLQRGTLRDSRQAFQKEVRGNVSYRIRRTFPTVCGDFAFYQFPTEDYWERLFGQTPRNFLFGFKVPEDITVSTWPKHARITGSGPAARTSTFWTPGCLPITSPAVGTLPRSGWPADLSFSTFNKSTFPTVADFMARLDPFLAALPKGFRYGIELRNPEYVTPAYFGLLSTHNVAHVFNAWTRHADPFRPGAIAGRIHGGFHRRPRTAAERHGLRQRRPEFRAIPRDPGAERQRARG